MALSGLWRVRVGTVTSIIFAIYLELFYMILPNFLPHPAKPASFGISISDPLFLQTEKNYNPECQNQMVIDRVGWMKSSGKSTYVHTVEIARGFLNFSGFLFWFLVDDL